MTGTSSEGKLMRKYPVGLAQLLYDLFHVDDPRRVPPIPPADLSRRLRRGRDVLRQECEALVWAAENPEFDFVSVLSTPYSNKDTLCYLVNLGDLYAREGVFEDLGVSWVEPGISESLGREYFDNNYVNPPMLLWNLLVLVDRAERARQARGEAAFRSEIVDSPFLVSNELFARALAAINWAEQHEQFDYRAHGKLSVDNERIIKALQDMKRVLLEHPPSEQT